MHTGVLECQFNFHSSSPGIVFRYSAASLFLWELGDEYCERVLMRHLYSRAIEMLEANRAAWKVPLGFDRYIGGGKD